MMYFRGVNTECASLSCLPSTSSFLPSLCLRASPAPPLPSPQPPRHEDNEDEDLLMIHLMSTKQSAVQLINFSAVCMCECLHVKT